MNERKKMRRALVIDDDPTQRTLQAAALEQAGFTVAEAENGQVALEILDDVGPSLILLDVEMPVMDGFDTCKAIRQHPDYRDVPIVMITGNGDTESIDKAYKMGATDFVAKPINWSLLTHRARYVHRAGDASFGLRESEAKNRAFIQAIPDTVLVIDRRSGEIERVGGGGNQAGDSLFANSGSLSLDDLPDKLAAAWRIQFEQVLATRQTHRGEFSRTEGDEKKHYETRIVPFTANRLLVMIRDISEQKQTSARVYQLAYFDTLTGLPNRQSFLTELSTGIRRAEKNNTMLSVLYLDLDNFKRINDSLGHSLGDELLKTISKRIENCVRADDHVARLGKSQSQLHLARLGGDEFTILLTDLKSPDEPEAVANRITDAVSQPILEDGHEFVITPSIGIANYPEDGQDIDTLLKNADIAMYSAKESGKNSFRQYSGTMSVRSLEHLELEHSLRRAILNDDLELHYQPKLSLDNGRITGVEALLRWTHPERGAISPAKFVPVAEDAGLILDLSDWVLHTTCKQIKAWESGQLQNLPIAINLSGKQFTHSDMYSVVMKALQQYAIDPSSIDLELTESELMRDADGTIGTLTRLKDAGLSLIVDDFGTGYSSLSYLKKFPIDALKIDRSFVMDLDKSDDNLSICAAIVALAHSLNLRVIAEGVEAEDHVYMLRQIMCNEIQGYHFCRPCNAVDVARFVIEYMQQEGSSPSIEQDIA